MNHLTWNELFDYLDDPTGSARRQEIQRHLDECPRCRRLVDSQRSFERTARRIDPVEPSANFTRRVVGILQGDRKERGLFRILTVLGAGIPLLLVGVLIGYAISLGGASDNQGTGDLFGGVLGDWGSAVERVQAALGTLLGDTGNAVAQAGKADVLLIAVLTLASVLLLLVADRMFLRRILRSRM